MSGVVRKQTKRPSSLSARNGGVMSRRPVSGIATTNTGKSDTRIFPKPRRVSGEGVHCNKNNTSHQGNTVAASGSQLMIQRQQQQQQQRQTTTHDEKQKQQRIQRTEPQVQEQETHQIQEYNTTMQSGKPQKCDSQYKSIIKNTHARTQLAFLVLLLLHSLTLCSSKRPAYS
jgi:hypothetical protein